MLNISISIFKSANTWIWLALIALLPQATSVVFHQSTHVFDWVIAPLSTPISITLAADSIGVIFSCVVLLISANVLTFSKIYIEEEKFKNRFTILVLLFIISINLLIYIPHFIVLLLGWDGLGIVSFILVIYYQNPKSLAAGIITALTNRIGDVLLLVSIGWTLNQGHWFIMGMWPSSTTFLQITCITLAAITKSAQMPFSRWLPAAMAAPTPVSALVHSSTLVTAGVFLLIRFYPFLHSISIFNTFILAVAVSTILIAGISATTECDAKKIIALSTLRQLGIIITRLGFNMPNLAFFHILTHALFKALLFICAGSYIHYHIHTQDLRWMGNTSLQIPIASRCISLANLALCGFPFIAGFYSKDIIIESAIRRPNRIFMLALSLISLGFTSFYSVRFSIRTIWRPTLISPWVSLKEENKIIFPILVLSAISIIAGRVLSWLQPVRSSIFILPWYLKISPLILVRIGGATAYYITSTKTLRELVPNNIISSYYASCNIWYLVPLSSQFILNYPLQITLFINKYIDQGWLELSSGQNLNKKLTIIGSSTISNSPKLPTSYLMVPIIIICTYLILMY